MANFIQIDWKNALTGAAINTQFFTDDEVPMGVKRNEDRQLIESRTTLGTSRMFPKPDGIEFSFSIVLALNATVEKLELFHTYSRLGYIADVKVLAGGNTFSPSIDRLVYNAGKATLLNAVLAEFPNDWRQMLAKGQKDRVEVLVRFRKAGTYTLPTPANWVGI